MISGSDTLPVGVPDLTLGWGVAKWAGKYLRQPNGPRAGERFVLTDRQLRFWLWWYALNPDGSWVYRHGVRRLAKGSGKSPSGAALALAELCGPVRLDRFEADAPGGCVGRAVSMPWVQIAACSESQTENTMRMVRAFAPKGSRIALDHGLDPGLTRYHKEGGGRLEVITASAHSAEGAETSFVVADETEWWLPGAGGPLFSSTLKDNLAKSGARMVETCNAWQPGSGSVAEDTWSAFEAELEGRARGGGRTLYDARSAPPDTDMADPDSLRRGLEFVYEDCPWADVPAIMGRVWDLTSRPDESKRKYLNWPTAADGAWADPQDWAKMADPSKVVADGERIGLFFDGSLSRDATALLGCRLSDGHVMTLGIWEPSGEHRAGAGTTVDPEEVDARVAAAFDRWDVAGFFADVREWESFARLTWPARYKDRLRVWAVPHGTPPEAVAWDMRSRAKEFTAACELTEAEIREGAFTHDGDSRLARHVANAVRYDSRWGVSVRKETPSSPRKIDGCVAMIGARMVRRLALAKVGEEPRRGRAFFL